MDAARLVECHSDAVDKVLLVLRSAIATGADWQTLDEYIRVGWVVGKGVLSRVPGRSQPSLACTHRHAYTEGAGGRESSGANDHRVQVERQQGRGGGDKAAAEVGPPGKDGAGGGLRAF